MTPRRSRSFHAAMMMLVLGASPSLAPAQENLTPLIPSARVGVPPEARVAAAGALGKLSNALGITDVNRDLREVSTRSDRHGRAHVAYERIVAGLPVRDMDLIVHVATAGAVESTTGAVMRLPTGAQEAIAQAATRAILTEADVRNAVLRDVAAAGHDTAQLARFVARKEAMTVAPWVAWRVDVTLAGARGRWIYDVDAASAAILSKRSNLQQGDGAAPASRSLHARSVNDCATLLGPPAAAPLSHTTPFIYAARILNVTAGRDGDRDGFPETFSFDLSIDADWGDVADSGYVAAIIRCPSTGQSWPTDYWWTSGQADDPVAFTLTQDTFGLAVPANASLDFTVELWNSTLTTRHDIESTVLGEPVRADHIVMGPKIGTGVGVRGNTLSHVDAYYDDSDYLFYLFDVSRQSGNNPHGHAGQMPASEVIETDVSDPAAPFIAYDFDDAWSASSQASAVDAHVGAGLVYDYLLGSLGLNGIDGDGASMFSLVDEPCGGDNAFWNGTEILFCEPVSVPSFAGALDVVAHEWGHAVTQRAAQPRRQDLTYAGESGALNESFSDWLGTAFEHSRGETNWTLGEGIWTLRDMANPHAYDQPDTYVNDPFWLPVSGCVPDDTNDGCGVHTNSGVPNKMFYLLSAGGTHGGVVVNGLGIATAMAIALDANIFYWPSTATFAQARAGMLQATEPLGVNATNQVANAWAAVGVGSPAGLSGLGDVAPRAAPNGVVDVGDVVTVLRFSVGLDGPTALERQRADVAPYVVVDATGSPRVIRVVPDGNTDVADVVILLRVSVNLDAFGN